MQPMKIWKFYKVSEVDNKPELYGITGIKEFAKSFLELRDMNKFKLVKGKMDRDDFGRFVKQNRSIYIDNYKFITSGHNKNGIIKATAIDIPIPTSEYETVIEEYDMLFNEFDYMDWNNIFALDMFNKKVTNALLRLGYYTAFRYNCRYIDSDDEEMVYDKIDQMETSFNIMPEFDEYKVYMILYGESYKDLK